MDPDATRVAALLVEIGQRLALAGENPYKTRAYAKAAESLLTLTIPLAEAIAAGRLREIPGVGAAIADTIATLHRDGTTPKLEALRQEVPTALLDLMRVPGLDPKKLLQAHRLLGISTREGLEQAAREGRLAQKKELGASFQAKALEGLERERLSRGRRLLHHAGEFLGRAADELARSHPELTRIVPAGDFRRGCELVSSLALVAEMPRAKRAPSIDLGEEITLRLAPASRYGAALLFATGSAAHWRELQAVAGERGLRLDETGLFRGSRLVACASEEEVYAALGLPFIPPALREGSGELECARAGRLPDLVTDASIRGLLHCHTDFSDGADTLEAMAEATRARGYAYFGVADHSRSAGYAGGLTLEEVAAQRVLADTLNRRYRGAFRIFRGIESDILEDGSLDYPEAVLRGFDFVVASVHGRFRLNRTEQTARILRAVANPYTTILGHMTGRLLLRRDGYDVDVEAILSACAEHGVAVEINANPHRLDLDWRWHQRALDLGCILSINPDAHSTAELDLTRWGVMVARKGGVPSERVLNCRDLDGITAFFAGRARQKGKRKGGRSASRP